MNKAANQLKQALNDNRMLVGTFVKTPSMMLAEVLALTDLDVCCIDAEHSPFDRSVIDAMILGFRAHDKAVVVRIPDHSSAHILNALDCGASGIVVPHVSTAEMAKKIVKDAYYGESGRGYAGSSRFASYTNTPLPQNIVNNREGTSVIAQIEDLSALDCIDDIMSVDGIDCFFIGIMDLTVALGETSASSPIVEKAVKKIIGSASKYKRCTGMFVPKVSDVPRWRSLGVSLFLQSSDHGFIKQGANDIVAALKQF